MKTFLWIVFLLALFVFSLPILAQIFWPMIFPSDRIIVINDTASIQSFSLLYRDNDKGEIITREVKEAMPGEQVTFSDYSGVPLCLSDVALDIYRLPEEIKQRVEKTQSSSYSQEIDVFTIKATDIIYLASKYPCTEIHTRLI